MRLVQIQHMCLWLEILHKYIVAAALWHPDLVDGLPDKWWGPCKRTAPKRNLLLLWFHIVSWRRNIASYKTFPWLSVNLSPKLGWRPTSCPRREIATQPEGCLFSSSVKNCLEIFDLTWPTNEKIILKTKAGTKNTQSHWSVVFFPCRRSYFHPELLLLRLG